MQDLTALLRASLDGLTIELASAAENIRALQVTESDIINSDAFAALERRMRAEDLRAEYRQYCEDCRRDLDPIEQECLGLPTFREWKEANGHA